jgi:hypothetical protein
MSSDRQGRDKMDGIVLTPAQQKSRNRRNVAIALAVGIFIVLIYFVTIAKLGPAVLDRPL